MSEKEQSSTSINITSTALEKGIDIAKNFLEKLILPAVEESGLLIKDQVTFWKFKNQVRMLNKAKNYCDKNNISPKHISLKLLCPLLDYSAIEEDEILSDKWAILLSNMVDSQQNIENHVFPYILSQVSQKEFLILENVFEEKQIKIEKLSKELAEYSKTKYELLAEYDERIKEYEGKLAELAPRSYGEGYWKLTTEKRNVEKQKQNHEMQEWHINYALKKTRKFSLR